MNYREEWQLFAEANINRIRKEEITAMISGQTSEATGQLQRYLWFDWILKIVSLTALLLAVFLILPNLQAMPLMVVAIAGIILAYSQYQVIRNQPRHDYTQSTLMVLGKVLTTTRLRINRMAFLVGTTNPLLILAGSSLYLYHKYGPSLTRSTEDFTVLLVLMFIGFMINFMAFSIQQNSVLNDLEISYHALVSENNSGLEEIARRRKRRQITTMVLMTVGFVLFLLLLSGILILS